MAVIVPSNQINVSSLTADDLYVLIQQPPGYITGTPTDVFGVVGTASYGPVNKAVHLGSNQDLLTQFGGISAASLTDPYDLATDVVLAFGQTSSQASLEGWAVRVTDGTDVAASTTISSGSAGTVETATLGGALTVNDVLHVTFTSSGIFGSPVSVAYTIMNTDSLYSAAAGLANSINASSSLKNAGISATVSGAVITIFYPQSLSVSFGESVSGSATETILLAPGVTSTNGITLTALFTGTLGNQFRATVGPGGASNSSSVYLVGPSGTAEYYPNLPNGSFWAALASAITGGLSGVRGPSNLVTASNVNPGAGPPVAGVYAFANGTDGRTGVMSATLLGVDGTPGTGLYALRQLSPPVSIVWIAGLTDSSIFPSLLAFGTSEASSTLASFPAGTSTSAALALAQANGLHDPSFQYLKDWIYFYDSVNGKVRLVPPYGIFGGTVGSLLPSESPSNKQVNLVIGTERRNPWTGNQPYSSSEVGQLEVAGITFITNPIPAGATWGIRHGQTTSLQPVTAPFEWWRMSAFLARSFASTMGKYVGKNQSQQPNDPLRRSVSNDLNNFLSFLRNPASGAGDGLGMIDDYSVVCTFSTTQNAGLGVNTPNSIAAHYLFALVRVRYLSSVRFFVLSLQGGTTVVTVGATPGTQLLTLPQAA